MQARSADQDQPHLHIMYCERSVDEHNRTAEQFFSRYNDKDPAKGGAQKITPDVRGKGKTIINEMRVDTEVIINEHLEKYAPTKISKNQRALMLKCQMLCHACIMKITTAFTAQT